MDCRLHHYNVLEVHWEDKEDGEEREEQGKWEEWKDWKRQEDLDGLEGLGDRQRRQPDDWQERKGWETLGLEGLKYLEDQLEYRLNSCQSSVGIQGFHQVSYQGVVKATVFGVVEDFKFKISEGLDQNWCFPDSALLAVSVQLRQLTGQSQENTNFGSSLLKF